LKKSTETMPTELAERLGLVTDAVREQPEIRFETISSSKGIEIIEKARSHTKN
jgi:hypothetical protein